MPAFDAALRPSSTSALRDFEGCSRRNSKIQEASQHSESRTPNLRGEPGKRRRSESPRHRDSERKTVFTMLEKNERGVFNRLGVKEEVCPHTPVTPNPNDTGTPKGKRRAITRVLRMEAFSKSEDSGGGHWKSRSKKQKSGIEEDDLSQPWVCEEMDPFTPHIRYFDFPKKTRMPSNVKTYDGSKDPEDHLKIFQAAAKVERWAMPTRDIPSKLPPTKEVYQRSCRDSSYKINEVESIEDFVQRFKSESRHVQGAPEYMRISGFMHGITNPEPIKRLHDKIPKSVDEMMRATTMFLRGRFTLLTKPLKEILALDKGKFKAPPPMSMPVEKRNNNKFCEFHGEVGHDTDECMHLKRQIEELIKAGKLSHVIKELQ
ncbi:hypothetical protein Tco_1089987 [Tanacetum coccineum]|uniref:Reverse transcriptase domain-containing protein n=1 Tax=Tanacetum coccineum TaxID=301880 RepID=A0ABQ5I459_9ASTR